MRIYVGAFEWRAAPVAPQMAWAPPVGVTFALDLRPLAEQASPGLVAPTLSALFVTPDSVLLPNAVQIASGPRERLTGAALLALTTAMQAPRLAAGNLDDLLWTLLTQHADSTGVRCAPGLMPTREGELELQAGAIARRVALDIAGPEWPLVQQQIRSEYRKVAARVAAGQAEPGLHRMMLTAWLEQLKLDAASYELLVPTDMPRELPLPHRTTLFEDFTTANSTTLGPAYTWTQYKDMVPDAAWEVFSNQVYCAAPGGSAGHMARCQSDLSSANHWSQVVITQLDSGTTNNQLGPVVRFASAAVTGYLARALQVFDTIQVEKVVAGTVTTIGAGVGITISLPQIAYVEANGSTLVAKYAGTQTHSFTDTAITGNTRCGLWGFRAGGGTLGDNWAASDLAGAPPALPALYYRQMRVRR